jgi:molecular chaperone IbpA
MKKYGYNFEFENTILNKLIDDTFNTNHVVYGDMLCGNAKKAGRDLITQSIISSGDKSDTRYPHYNIVEIGENNWVIDIALAGWDKSNINVEENDGYLVVSGKQPEDTNLKYIHRGIALRSFKKSFKLTEWMVVRRVTMLNGILSINIELVVPEEKKPKKFNIG